MLSDSRSAARIQTHTSTSTLTHTLWYLVVVVVLGLNFASLASAQVTTCTTGALPSGNGGDLIVTGPGTCTVNAGTYQYHNVNIILGGTLLFTDSQIDFWAESILVENSGSLIAGSPTFSYRHGGRAHYLPPLWSGSGHLGQRARHSVRDPGERPHRPLRHSYQHLDL